MFVTESWNFLANDNFWSAAKRRRFESAEVSAHSKS